MLRTEQGYKDLMQKTELRKWAKAKRRAIKYDNNALCQKLQETLEYKQAKNVMIFYPLKDEVNLLSLLEDKSKNFYLPKIDGENLLCCPYGEELCESCFKTLEPLTEPCDKNIIDLVVLPALCCDRNNYRLGYGGGFYDRFLKDYTGKTAVCLPKELIVETIFPENHDVKIDLIIVA